MLAVFVGTAGAEYIFVRLMPLLGVSNLACLVTVGMGNYQG